MARFEREHEGLFRLDTGYAGGTIFFGEAVARFGGLKEHPVSVSKVGCKERVEPEVEAIPISVPPAALSHLRVLLADEATAERNVWAASLANAGFTVNSVEGGRHAVEAVKKERFDVVVISGELPEMDGFEATAAIRELERGQGTRIPIVCRTTGTKRKDRERCVSAGMNGYVPRPVNPSELLSVIRDLLGVAASF